MRITLFILCFLLSSVLPAQDADSLPHFIRAFNSQVGVLAEYGFVATLKPYSYNSENSYEINEFREMRAREITSFEPYFIVPIDRESGRHLLGASVFFQTATWEGIHNTITLNSSNTQLNYFSPEGKYTRISPSYYYRARIRPRTEWLVGIATPVGTTSGFRLQQQFTVQTGKWLAVNLRTSAEWFTVTPSMVFGKVPTYSRYSGIFIGASAGLAFSHQEYSEKKSVAALDSIRRERQLRTEFITWIGRGFGRFIGNYDLLYVTSSDAIRYRQITMLSYGPEWRRLMRRNQRISASVRFTMNLTRYISEDIFTASGAVFKYHETFNILQLAVGAGYTMLQKGKFQIDGSLLGEEGFDLRVRRPFLSASAALALRLNFEKGGGFILSPQYELSPFNRSFYSQEMSDVYFHDGRYRYSLLRVYAGIAFPLKSKAVN